tara:strand:+ start:1000 stop:2112 length:1113 start_codon:yes stop_codon:yes gene_type:complete
MSDAQEKIALDDISFDDMFDGVSMDSETNTEEVVEEPTNETPEAAELDEDAALMSEEPEGEVEEEDDEELEDELDEVEEKENVTEEAEEDGTLVGEILSKLGYEVEDEYEDTTEGLLQLTQDMSSKMAEDQLDNLFEKFPLVKNHLEYVLNGGDSQEFMQAYDPNLDYDQIELDEDDVRSQKGILADYFAAKGHDNEFIEEMLDDYEDTGKLFQKSEAARKALAKSQVAQRQQLLEQQKQQRAQQEEEQTQFWNGVYETISNTDEFAGITVPKKDKAKFFDYVSKPVTKEGFTQRDLDHREAQMDVKLAIDYLMYKGFNLDKIINTKAKTKATTSLRDRISKNEERVKSARKASRRPSSAIDLDALDLDI